MPGSGEQGRALASLGQIPGNVAQQQSAMVNQNAMAQRTQALERQNQQQKELQTYVKTPEFQQAFEALPPATKAIVKGQMLNNDMAGALKTVHEARAETQPIPLGGGNVGMKLPNGGWRIMNPMTGITMEYGADMKPVNGGTYASGAAVRPEDAIPDEDGHQETWLKAAVPPQYQNQVRAIGRGDQPLPPQGRGGLPAQLAAWANVYNPNLSAATFPERKKAATDYAPSGVTGKGIISLATLLQHGDELRSNVEALDNTDYPAANTIKNEIDYQRGGSKRTDFNRTRDLITKELDTLVSGGHATMGETAQIRENISHANSPQQLQSAIDGIARLAEARLQSLTQQGQVALGKKGMQDLSEQLHNPQAMHAFTNIQQNPIKNSDRWKALQAAKAAQDAGTMPAAAPQGGAPQSASTSQGQPQAQGATPPISMLHEGHKTTFPRNGQVWTLRNGQPVRLQ
jgi:hypothetical protein